MSVGVFAAVFLLYLGCLYPAIAPRDAADMASTAWTLGVAHAPGYPLYSALGRAWLAAFPWGGSAYRLNVLSALAGAAAAAGLFVLVRRRAGAVAGVVAAALWALSAPLWKFSLLSEKYSLHALFAVSLLLLAEGESGSATPRARLTGLLLGLGLVNHQTLLLWIPGLWWLWRPNARLFRAALPAFLAGGALNAFLWIRLGSWGQAWQTVLRARYGAATLSASLARPLTSQTAADLLIYSARGLIDAVSWPVAIAALVGIAAAWRADRRRAVGWILGAAAAGPFFIVLSRVDPANWVARTVLEPAFLLPTMVAAAFAGEAVGGLQRRHRGAAAIAAAALVAGALFLRAPLPEHRDDFLAYDYLRDLRRAVPPGGALLAAGDTASFGLRWLGLVAPEPLPREGAAALLVDMLSWLKARAGRTDVYVTGLGLASLQGLGPMAPAGLVQHAGPAPVSPPLSVLRRPRAWARGESYAHDVRLSYAFSSWLSARLLQARGAPPAALEPLDMSAAAIDPEDYQLE